MRLVELEREPLIGSGDHILEMVPVETAGGFLRQPGERDWCHTVPVGHISDEAEDVRQKMGAKRLLQVGGGLHSKFVGEEPPAITPQ